MLTPATVASPPEGAAPGHDGEWADIRCYHCRRLLARVKGEPGRAMRPEKSLQIKCKCNSVNYVVGTPDE